MADNATKIAQIRALLQTGAKASGSDGEHTSFDLDSLRQELRRLEDEDATAQTRRPFAASIRFG